MPLAQPYIISPMAAAFASLVSFTGRPNLSDTILANGIIPRHFEIEGGSFNIAGIIITIWCADSDAGKFIQTTCFLNHWHQFGVQFVNKILHTFGWLVNNLSCFSICPFLSTIPNLVLVPPISIPIANFDIYKSLKAPLV